MQGIEEVDRMLQLFWNYIPSLVGALAILIVGWLIALGVSKLLRSTLHRTTLDNRLAVWLIGDAGQGARVEETAGLGVFYLIMLFVLVAFFQALGLTLITEPINRLLTQVFQFAPQLLGAAILLIVAWVVARVVKQVVTKGLSAAGIDRQVASGMGSPDAGQGGSLAAGLGEAAYWLVFLLFLPAILSTLALEGLLHPVQGMVDKVLAFLPNLLAAALILAVGWFVARIVQRLSANLLAGVGVDRLGERVGLSNALGGQQLSGLIALIAYILVLIPVLISSLNALQLDAITVPASQMLNSILAALPVIFGAGLIILIAYAVGRVVAGLVANLLAGVGFNSLLARLGLGNEPGSGERTLSEIAGTLVLAAIMLFAATEALEMLGFVAIAGLVAQFMVFAGQIVMGLIVLAIGLFLANLAASAIQASNVGQASALATVTRVAILVLIGAMALRQMGIANEIINLAFGLILGGIVVAAAIAFGIGGREIAGRELGRWIDSMRSKNS